MDLPQSTPKSRELSRSKTESGSKKLLYCCDRSQGFVEISRLYHEASAASTLSSGHFTNRGLQEKTISYFRKSRMIGVHLMTPVAPS